MNSTTANKSGMTATLVVAVALSAAILNNAQSVLNLTDLTLSSHTYSNDTYVTSLSIPLHCGESLVNKPMANFTSVLSLSLMESAINHAQYVWIDLLSADTTWIDVDRGNFWRDYLTPFWRL